MLTKCIIIDDEPNALKLLEEYLLKTPGFILQGKFHDGLEALAYLRNHTADIIFTDINMPLLSGLDLAGILPKNQKIVFTTAYAEYAMSSFEYCVIDYLVKPISFKRFTTAVEKIKILQGIAEPAVEIIDGTYIFLKQNKQLIRVELNSITYIEAVKEYIKVHIAGNKNYLIYKRIKEIEQQLPSNFLRIHNSYIVNTGHIQTINLPYITITQTELPVSNTYKKSFLSFLKTRII